MDVVLKYINNTATKTDENKSNTKNANAKNKNPQQSNQQKTAKKNKSNENIKQQQQQQLTAEKVKDDEKNLKEQKESVVVDSEPEKNKTYALYQTTATTTTTPTTTATINLANNNILNGDIFVDGDGNDDDVFKTEKQKSNEFVIVKARKTRKQDKKLQPPVQRQSKETSMDVPKVHQTQNNNNSHNKHGAKVSNNKEKISEQSFQPSKSTPTNLKPTETKPSLEHSETNSNEQATTSQNTMSTLDGITRIQHKAEAENKQKSEEFINNFNKFPSLVTPQGSETDKQEATMSDNLDQQKPAQKSEPELVTKKPDKPKSKTVSANHASTESVIFLDELKSHAKQQNQTNKKEMNKKLSSGNSLGIKFGCFNTTSESESDIENENVSLRTSTSMNDFESDLDVSLDLQNKRQQHHQYYPSADHHQQLDGQSHMYQQLLTTQQPQQSVFCMTTHPYFVTAANQQPYPFYNAPIQFFYTSTMNPHSNDIPNVNTITATTTNQQYTPVVALAATTTQSIMHQQQSYHISNSGHHPNLYIFNEVAAAAVLTTPTTTTTQSSRYYDSQQSTDNKTIINLIKQQQQQQQKQNEMIYVNTTSKKSSHTNHSTNNSPTIIADALQMAYSVDKGCFNLDEAVQHFSSEWNRIKNQLINGT